MKLPDTLSERLDALEIEIGTNQVWPESVHGDAADQKTLVNEIASLQARVEHIFNENPALRDLPNILKTYHTGSEPTAADDVEGSQTLGENEPSGGHLSVAEKQELILVKYPEIIECYHQLVEFSALDVPKLSRDLVDGLNLSPMMDKKALCDSIANQFHLLVVKTLILYEEFVSVIKQQTAFLQNVNSRLRSLASKLAMLERKRQMERKY